MSRTHAAAIYGQLPGIAFKTSCFNSQNPLKKAMPSPLILVTPSTDRKGVEFYDTSSSLSFCYEDAVLKGGGIPVVAPMTADRSEISEEVRVV